VSSPRRVLVIGKLISYELLDVELIENQGIEPWFLFLNSDKIPDDFPYKVCLVESLCEPTVKSLVCEKDITAICCFNDNFLLQVSNIRDELGLTGIKSEEMKKFKRKSSMYNALSPVVQTIPYIKVEPGLTYQQLEYTLGLPPYFVKPDQLAGAEGTLKIDCKEEFEKFMGKFDQKQNSLIIQPYIDAELYHCEMFVHKGNVIYSQARKYSYPNHKILEGKIIASFPIEDRTIEIELEKLAEDVQKTLKFENGVMHTEFFIDSGNNISFLETNIRQPGGAINLIHRKRTGISVETAMILLELEKNIDFNVDSSKLYTSGYIPMKKGIVDGFTIPKLSGKVEFDKRVQIGQSCDQPTSASHASISYLGEYLSIKTMKEDFKLIEQCGIVNYK
jgi:hypothetical protein